jgi:hypothetical protein
VAGRIEHVQPICYLNTDLDLVSASDVTEVVAALETRGLYALNVGQWEDGLFHATLETSESYGEPEATIAAMLDAVEAFPEGVRGQWLALQVREFNIGYDCGDRPWAYNQGLTNRTLRRLADAQATLRVTLYPPQARRGRGGGGAV